MTKTVKELTYEHSAFEQRNERIESMSAFKLSMLATTVTAQLALVGCENNSTSQANSINSASDARPSPNEGGTDVSTATNPPAGS